MKSTVVATLITTLMLQRAAAQTISTATSTPSCLFKLSDFGYPSDCPSLSSPSINTVAMDYCQTLCSDRCIVPLLAYMEACDMDTSILNAWCGTSTGNGQLCCTLGTTLTGSLEALGFYTFCDSSLTCFSGSPVRSSCAAAYQEYGCCFANLKPYLQPTFNWGACGFSAPETCPYDPWPLPISKKLFIIIMAAGGGGLLLLCVAACVCCCCCCVIAGSRRRTVVSVGPGGGSKGRYAPINSGDVECSQLP